MAYPGRILSADVAKIVDIDPTLDVTSPIDFANELVTEVCASVKKADGVTPFYSDHRLFCIEQLLAAHFYCINDPKSRRERVGPLLFESQSKVDLGLDVTHYGQQAKRLDTNGGLAALDEALKDGKVPGKFVCSLKWLGRREFSGPIYD